MNTQLHAAGTEVWRGGISAWECDEMGHMNTRFYVARCMEGVAVLFAMAGLPGLFAPESERALRVDDLHIRFHREALAATPLHGTAGFVAVDDDEAEIVFLLHHSGSGAIAATFLLRVALVTSKTGQPQAWPAEFCASARAFMMGVPEPARPRSLLPASTPPFPTAGLNAYKRIAMGALGPEACDVFGRVLPQKFVGLLADGIRQIVGPLREIVVEHAEPRPARFGGALLEFRLAAVSSPGIGAAHEVRSALVGVDKRTMRVESWIIDPVSQAVYAHLQSIAVVFDLDRRQIVPISDDALAAMQSALVG